LCRPPTVRDDERVLDAPGERAENVSFTFKAVPVELFRRWADHREELHRECSLLLVKETSNGPTDSTRLTELCEQLCGVYEALSELEEQVTASERRGDQSVDLTLVLSRETAEQLLVVESLFAAIEEHGRADQLLTAEPGSEVVSFRRWFENQLLAQLSDFDPESWEPKNAGDGWR
jgi:hypothetical protein